MAVTNGTSNFTSNGATSSTTNGMPSNTPNTSPDADENAPLPIVIAGGGCVGLFLALLLSHTSPPLPNSIIVIEPQTPDPTSTRAMAHQPPTFPILSQIPGLLEELINAGSLSSGLCFRTSVANGSKVIAEKKFGNSGKGQLLLPQGKFQEILMKRLSARSGTELRIGHSVTGFSTNRLSNNKSSTTDSDSDSITVHINSTTPDQDQEIKAAYLIDASGAHSPIRKSLSLTLVGTTLDSTLVATDIHFPFSTHSFHDANFIIDPLDYGLIGRILPATSTTPELWRVSYGIPGTPSTEEIESGVHEKLARMLPNRGEDGGERVYEVVRIAPYKAHQRLSPTMYIQSNKTLLIGDAAHLTNPYAGLGLASGLFDASSLAPILHRILCNEAADPDALLQSWSDARREKFLSVVDKPSRMSYMRVRSDVSSQEKVGELLARDPLVRALKEGGMPVMPPSLETRGEELVGW